MASISSVSGTNSSSSIYGNRNVLSGLASGMDTESMIENAVSGIKTKITNLEKKRTKVGWQQDAYRSIISKMVSFNNKYTSYTSKTNLLSNSFFNNAVSTTTNGANASKVSATGKTSSEVAINGVRQLATAARYTVSGGFLGGSSDIPTAVADESIDLNKMMDISTISGTMSLKYGNKTVDLNFGELETTFDSAEDLAKAIQEKLSEQKITLSSGEQKAADKLIGVSVNGNTIQFSDKSTGGNSIYISSASANIKEKLGIDTSSDAKQNKFTVSDFSTLKTEKKTSDYLSDKTMSISLDGVTKSIGMPTAEEIQAFKDSHTPTGGAAPADNEAYVGVLQNKIDKAFGAGKMTVKNSSTDAGAGKLQLQFEAKKGSTFSVSSKVDEAMGFEKGLTSYLNTGKTLGDMGILDGLEAVHYTGSEPFADVRKTEGEGDKLKYYYEKDGKKIYTDKDGNHVNSDGKKLYSFELNGVEVGQFTEDTALESVLTSINNNSEAGVKVSYSKITNEFVFTAKETGAGGQMAFGSGLADKMFGLNDEVSVVGSDGSITFYEKKLDADGNAVLDADGKPVADTTKKVYTAVSVTGDDGSVTFYEQKLDADGNAVLDTNGKAVADTTKKITSAAVGQDAIFTATINGNQMELTRSSNVVDMDGLTVTLKDKFGYQLDTDGKVQVGADGIGRLDSTSEEVTFTTTADADTIVDAIRGMVDDYNEMISEIKKAYSTQPAEKRNHARYEPLTDEDMAEMSEASIKAYEEKAKQGILFADSDLSSLYSKLRSAVAPSGSDGAFLRSIGIGTDYNDGLTTLTLNETDLRNALESDPDKVRDAFTKTKESGSATNGIMQNLKTNLDNYASTTGASKGVLIQKAGSPLAPTSILDNSLKSMLDNYDKQIETWQDKLSDKVDYYTSKFTQLEKLISEMNSQSSALAGMMGTGS